VDPLKIRLGVPNQVLLQNILFPMPCFQGLEPHQHLNDVQPMSGFRLSLEDLLVADGAELHALASKKPFQRFLILYRYGTRGFDLDYLSWARASPDIKVRRIASVTDPQSKWLRYEMRYLRVRLEETAIQVLGWGVAFAAVGGVLGELLVREVGSNLKLLTSVVLLRDQLGLRPDLGGVGSS